MLFDGAVTTLYTCPNFSIKAFKEKSQPPKSSPQSVFKVFPLSAASSISSENIFISSGTIDNTDAYCK